MEEDGRASMFESGAIVLDIALRSGKLLPSDADERSIALSWYFAALNSVEPALANVAEVDFFMKDEAQKEARRPTVLDFAQRRLRELDAGLGNRTWFAGDDFSIADLMIASVLKIARSLDLLAEAPALAAHQQRCFDRPAYRDAIADQCAAFADHGPADMKYEQR